MKKTTKKPVIVNTYNIRPGEALDGFLSDKVRTDSNGIEIPNLSESAMLVFDSRNGIDDVKIHYNAESGTVTFTGYCESGKIKV